MVIGERGDLSQPRSESTKRENRPQLIQRLRSAVPSISGIASSYAVGGLDHIGLEHYFGERAANGAWIHGGLLDTWWKYKLVYETGNAWWAGIPVGIAMNYLADVLSQSRFAQDHPYFKNVIDNSAVRAVTIGIIGAASTALFEIQQIAQQLPGFLHPSMENGDFLTGAAVTFGVLAGMEGFRAIRGKIKSIHETRAATRAAARVIDISRLQDMPPNKAA